MSEETFAAALRAEIDAVVGRYEALVRALAQAGGRETEALRAEASRLAAENQRLHAAEVEARAAIARLETRVADLTRELAEVRARGEKLEEEARSASARTAAYEEQFTAEKAFVDACRDLRDTLLGEAFAGTLGRPLEASTAVYAALKSRGLEGALVSAFRDRGKSAVSAPLLERERAALPAVAAAAGCELITPPAGTRFSAQSMEKASTVSDPAEEGNVVDCAMPGLRRSGTEGALVFPRVVVATG
jgi:hypothetical protein